MAAISSGLYGMSNKFVLSVGPIKLGSWTKVSGLSVKWDVVNHRVGNSDAVYAFAGVANFEKLKLQRALDSTAATATKNWLKTVQMTGGTSTETGSLKMLTAAGKPVFTWTLKAVFPSSWSISEFDAGSSKVLMETLEIVHEGFFDVAMKYA